VVVPSIRSDSHGMISGIEMFGFDGELFFSVGKFEEESNLMESVRITGINPEPLSFVSSNINEILDILL
jgi:hypothetical protein